MGSLPTEPMRVDETLAAWPILSPLERREALAQLPTEEGAELFQMLVAADQAELLLAFDPDGRRRFLKLLAPDDLADVFQELDEQARRDVFRSLTAEALEEVEQLAAYDWDDAGGIMTPDFAHVTPEMNADQAIVALRLQLRDNPETLRYIYVVERDRRLAGVVSIRQLFGAPPGALVRNLMETDVVSVREDTDQEAVARLMRDHGIVAIPVLDDAGRIRGIVTADDVIEIMEEEATEDIQMLAAVAPSEVEYTRGGIGHFWIKRVGWLLFLLVTGFLTSAVIERYQTTLQAAVVLAFYVPLLIGAGGNTGTQSATLVIRSLATGDLQPRDWWRVVVKELGVGILLGLTLAVALGLRGYFSDQGGARIALIVGATMVAVVLWANLVGALLPLVLRAVRLDPAVVSAPLVSTLVDATGLLIYFNIASRLLHA